MRSSRLKKKNLFIWDLLKLLTIDSSFPRRVSIGLLDIWKQLYIIYVELFPWIIIHDNSRQLVHKNIYLCVKIKVKMENF